MDGGVTFLKIKKYNHNLLNCYNVCYRLPFLLSFFYLLAKLDIDEGISHVLLVHDLAVPVLHIRDISKHSGLLVAWGGGQKDQDPKMPPPSPTHLKSDFHFENTKNQCIHFRPLSTTFLEGTCRGGGFLYKKLISSDLLVIESNLRFTKEPFKYEININV